MVVSVKLLRVVLLPLDGLPTSAMRGSRGMVRWVVVKEKVRWMLKVECPVMCWGLFVARLLLRLC